MDSRALSAPHALAVLVAPGLRLLSGPRSLLRAGLVWMVAHLPLPAPLVVVDGGNGFDVYLLAEVAAHLGQAPGDLLARVHVARAFTAHQLVALVEAGEAEMQRAGGRHALVLAPLDLLFHGDLQEREALRLLERLTGGLRRLGRPPRSAVVVCPDPPAAVGARAGFLERLVPLAAAHYRFEADQPVPAGAKGLSSRRARTGPPAAAEDRTCNHRWSEAQAPAGPDGGVRGVGEEGRGCGVDPAQPTPLSAGRRS